MLHNPLRRYWQGGRVALAAGILAAPGATVQAQTWPAKPVRLVVPYVPGGATDLVSRTVAERLTGVLGQQVVVDNRPGATGTIAFDMVAKSVADGYTLITAADSLSLLPSTFRNITFDPRTSFATITLMSTQPLVLAVHQSVPVTTIRAFIALAKAKPGSLTFASSGIGSSQHLAGEMIKKMAGIDMQHVGYKGGGQAIIDLSGGQIPVAVLGSSTVIPQWKTGRVRILAVTSKQRSAALPDVPTLAESGLTGFDVYQWTAMLAPAKAPPRIVARLNRDVTSVLKQPEVRERLATAGFEAQSSSPAEVEALIRNGVSQWGRLIEELKLDLR